MAQRIERRMAIGNRPPSLSGEVLVVERKGASLPGEVLAVGRKGASLPGEVLAVGDGKGRARFSPASASTSPVQLGPRKNQRIEDEDEDDTENETFALPNLLNLHHITHAQRITIMKPSRFRARFLRWTFILVFLGSVAGGIQSIRLEYAWAKKEHLDPSGGRYFFHRVELPVPSFRQGDDRWRYDLLGPTQNTLGAEGCAVSSAAMVLASYGIDTDPQRLNEFLKGNGGYTPEGWIYWEKAAELSNGHVQKAYEDLPSYSLIDSNLDHRNPVIVRLRLPSGITHFVVIAGKDGFDYLTRDPGAGASKGLYPLREFGSRIEALRYYEQVP